MSRVEQARAALKARQTERVNADTRAQALATLADNTDYALEMARKMRAIAVGIGEGEIVALYNTAIAALEDTQEEIQK